MTDNVLIAYGNRADEAALSGGSYRPALPLTNLQDRRLGKVARSTNLLAASTMFTATLGDYKTVRVIGLVGHNLSPDAQYRFRGSSDPTFATSEYDSGWTNVWSSVYPFGSLPWGAPNWWPGTYALEEIENYTWNIVRDLGDTYVLPNWKFEFSDPNNPDGYVDAGRLFMGPAWQPQRNMDYGGSLAWEDPSPIQTAKSGAEYPNKRKPYRVARFVTGQLSEDEGMANAFEIQGRMGITGEVLFFWNPNDGVHAIRRQFYGRLRSLSPVEFPYGRTTDGQQRNVAGWEVKEMTK